MIRQAHDRIPGYPLAIAAMAEVAARRGRFSFEVSIDLARLAVTKDPNCGECQAIAGYVLMTRGWKWDEAGRRLERAIELDGSNTTRRIWYAEWLAIQNRLPEAVRQAEIAVRTAPTEPRTHTILAGVLYFSGRYQEAARAAEKATSLDERLQPAHYWAYRIAMVTGDDIGAIMARNRNLTGYHSRHEEEFYKNYFDDLKIYQKQGGRRAVVQAWLESVNEGPPLQVQRYARATWSMWIGEREKALTELEAAVESKPYHIIHVAVDPIFAPLRSEARFQEVVRRVGLRL
jgi:tetratricopeptide (TPR) repeat protein